MHTDLSKKNIKAFRYQRTRRLEGGGLYMNNLIKIINQSAKRDTYTNLCSKYYYSKPRSKLLPNFI